MIKQYLIILFVLLIGERSFSQRCDKTIAAFTPNEKISFTISYNWGFIWVDAGEVIFSTKLVDYEGKKAYHFVGEGGTYEKYDWFYKVRDKYEAWSDTATLAPYKFYRDVSEGGDKKSNLYLFKEDSVKMKKVTEKKVWEETLPVPACSFDVLSMVYYCRTIDFKRYSPNEKIPLTMILDNEIQAIFIRYIGKEKIVLENGDTYNTLKFRPLLVAGSVFKGGESMTVWVTDDNNRIPVKVEAEIIVGKVIGTVNKIEGKKSL